VNSVDIITNTAIKTLHLEASALMEAQKYINNDFVDTVQAVLNCKSRLVITGVGKSALIGQKIVSTLNSTGTPSIFMHAADAVHGDLGMIVEGDLVCCISKSGNTPEIKILVPLLKNRGISIIAMVCNKESYLAFESDYLLFTPVEREADPNNLAPTTSTTVQMALGDALATALLVTKKFTAKDFAQFHPGGILGKKLTLKVDHIYRQNESPAVLPGEELNRIIFEISSKRLGATAVVNENQQLIGIITDGDIRRMLMNNKDIEGIKAKDIMTPDPKTINPELLAVEALELMRLNSITQLIVVDTGREYLGVIHLHDLLREGLL
jgi:arabinose-5-phosphate isomerase